MSLTINDVLTRKVHTISPDISVADAARLMNEKRISCLVAIKSDKPVGIITESDLVQIAHKKINLNQTCISGFLSVPVISIGENQSIYDAFEILLQHHVRHLVVVYPDGRMTGILTFSDILKAAEFDDFLRVKPVNAVMSCHVVSASPETPLAEVLARMDEQHLSCMVVLEDEKVCGIFTERDVARLLAPNVDINKLILGEVMSSPLITMQSGASMLDAALLMRQHKVRRIVVVDADQKPSGIVTQFDLVRGMEGKAIHHFQSLYHQMEGQLLIEKTELERIVEASRAVLYRFQWRADDKSFVPTYVSSSVMTMLGYEHYECLEANWWQSHIHPDDLRAVNFHRRHVQEDDKEFECIYRFLTKSGAYCWLRDHAYLNKGEQGREDELIGSWLDVTESRQRDQQVHESEELYRSLVEQAFDGIVIVAANGCVVFANEASGLIWGGESRAMKDRHYLEFVHPDEHKRMALNFMQRMDGNGPKKPYEIRLLRKDGDTAWVEMTGRLITWQDQPADLLTLRDITEKKDAESALLLHRDRSDALLKLPALASQLGELEFIQQAQELMETLTGSCISFVHFVKDDAETIELTAWSHRTLESYCEADYKKHYPVSEAGIWADALRRKSAVIFNDYPAYSNKKGLPEGHAELYRLISVPVIEAGQVVLLSGVGNKDSHYDDRDIESVQLISDAIWQIVQRQREQRSLINSEEKYRTLFEESRDMMHIVGTDGCILDVNQAELDVLGYAYDELVGQPVKNIICPKHLEDSRHRIRQLFEGKSVPLYQTALHSKSGQCIPVEVSASPQLDDGDVVAGRAVIHDLRERIQHETRELEFNQILEESLNEIYIMSADSLNFLRVNRGARLNLGYELHELLTMTPVDIKPDFTMQQFNDVITPLQRGEQESIDFETRHQRKDGSRYSVRVNLQRSTFDGEPVYVAFIQDISARKASEQKYRTLFESSSDAILMLDAEVILDCNEASLQMFACHSRDDFIGKHPSELSPEKQPGGYDSIRLANEHIAAAFRKGSHHFEWVHKRLDGSEFPADILLAVVDLGERVVLQATARDITERKQKEALLARRERQLAVLTEAGKNINETLDEQQVGRKLVDYARKLVICESGAVGFYRDGEVVFTEYSKGEQHQSICYRFASGYGVPGHVAKTGKSYVSNDALNDEYVIAEIQQKLGFVRLVDVPILDADGAILGCFEMHDRLDGQDFDTQDIEMLETLSGIASGALLNSRLLEIKVQREHELTDIARQLSDAQHIAQLGYYVLDTQSGTWSNSSELDDMFGIDEHFSRDIEGWLQIVHPDFQASMASYLQDDVLRQHIPFDREYKIINLKTGKEAWVHGLGELRIDNNQQVRGMFGTIQDISARKKTEEEMRLLESAIAAVNESIIITDSEGTIVYVNPSFTSNTGFEADYAIGRTPAILNSKQQSTLFYEQFWNTISHGNPWAGRIMDRKKDGTIFPVYLSVAPIFDGQGEISHYIALHEDLSHAEALQKKMAQTQKMEAVGTMVGGVAHDFNNMLASIVGNFYLIRRQYPDDEKLQQRIASMEDATQHGANLIRQMLTFARKDITEMHSLPLRSFIKEAHKLADAAMPESIHFGLNISCTEYVCVKADATQLQQVLLNLVTNARHAVQDRFGDSGLGSICIELLCEQPPAKLLQGNPEMLNESNWVCIRCVDNGAGISAENMEHVFEPFFSTKEPGRGTGLGLAMVFGAVQNHRGLIDIDSTPGQGTTLSIWLPQHSAITEVVVDDGNDMDVDGAGRVILLVDDEVALRRVLVEVLQQNNFTVLQAGDGEQAVAQFKANRDAIALVLMDVVMPNKGGVVAAQEIRAMDADVPIVFQTGYGEQTQLDAAGSINYSAALQKPVHIPDMLKMLMGMMRN